MCRVEVDPAIVKMMWQKVKRASVHMEITEDVEKRRANKFKGMLHAPRATTTIVHWLAGGSYGKCADCVCARFPDVVQRKIQLNRMLKEAKGKGELKKHQ